MSADQTEAVELPTRIVERVEQRLPRTEFDSSGEYIAYVMEEVLYRINADTADGEFEEVGEDKVRDRLESLGYLNQ